MESKETTDALQKVRSEANRLGYEISSFEKIDGNRHIAFLKQDILTEKSTELFGDSSEIRDEILDLIGTEWKPNSEGDYPDLSAKKIKHLHGLIVKLMVAFAVWDGAIEVEEFLKEKLSEDKN